MRRLSIRFSVNGVFNKWDHGWQCNFSWIKASPQPFTPLWKPHFYAPLHILSSLFKFEIFFISEAWEPVTQKCNASLHIYMYTSHFGLNTGNVCFSLSTARGKGANFTTWTASKLPPFICVLYGSQYQVFCFNVLSGQTLTGRQFQANIKSACQRTQTKKILGLRDIVQNRLSRSKWVINGAPDSPRALRKNT